MASDYYVTGIDNGDDQSGYEGYSFDTCRYTKQAPEIDIPDVIQYYLFGSATPSGATCSFATAPARMIRYSIDLTTHQRLGNRKDGKTIDAQELVMTA